MKLTRIGLAAFAALVVGGCAPGSDGQIESTVEPIVGPSTLGGRNEVVMLYARFQIPSGAVATRFCSGSYFAPRVVATAAHCLPDIFADQLFVYYGDNFDADIGQLVDGPNGLEAPAPGQPSFWAQADSFEIHPSYTADQHYPDLGVVYLDRKLPFDPLPLSRTSLAANRVVTISGWGANSAPDADHRRRRPRAAHRHLAHPGLADRGRLPPRGSEPGLLVPANRPT